MSLEKDYNDWTDSAAEADVEVSIGVTEDGEQYFSFRREGEVNLTFASSFSEPLAASGTITLVSPKNERVLMLSTSGPCSVTPHALAAITDITFMLWSWSYAVTTPTTETITNTGADPINVELVFLEG